MDRLRLGIRTAWRIRDPWFLWLMAGNVLLAAWLLSKLSRG